MSPAYEKSAAYRDRQREEDAWRLQVYLPAQYRQLVADTAARLGVTNKAAIQYLLDTGATMYEDLTPEIALQNAPNDRVRAALRKQFIESGLMKDGLTPSEQAELAKLANSIAESNVEARHLQAHGGQASLDTQNRVASSWLANNVHTQK